MAINRIFPDPNRSGVTLAIPEDWGKDPNKSVEKEKTTSTQLKQASQSTEEGGSGKVTYDAHSGRFIQGGKKMTLTALMYEITTKASNVAKETLALSMQELSDSNAEGDAALEWQNTFSSIKPHDDGSVYGVDVAHAVAAFKLKHGFNPMEKWDLDKDKVNGKFDSKAVDGVLRDMKARLGTIKNNQSKTNIDIERYTHVVEESEQLLASVNKSISDVDSSLINKIS